MFACASVFAGMFIWRVVAATRAATFLTRAQMNPFPADFHAILALPAPGMFNSFDSVDVHAGRFGHGSPFLFVQYSMHKGDCDRSFTHRRRHSLDVAGSNVADCKHSRQTGFEQMGSASERPLGSGKIVGRKIRPSL